MAFSMTARFLMKNKLLKSELVLRNLPKTNTILMLANQYVQAIRDLKGAVNYGELVQFPLKYFQKFPKSELKNVIDESFNLVKEKGQAKNAYMYNKVMESYMNYDIRFDMNALLHEMTENQINYNLETYSNIIKFFCRQGEMVTVEYFLEKIKSENISIKLMDEREIISGYIISGQPDKSKAFIRENGLNENSKEILVSEAKGYATIGDVNNVVNILNKMEESNFTCAPEYYCFLYRLLIQANVPESNLEKIFELMKNFVMKNPDIIYNTISKLNFNEHFDNSLYLVEKFVDVMDSKLANILITSFNKPNCPVETYKKVLKLLMNKIYGQKHVFNYMDLDDAFEFGKSIINSENKEAICTSLISQAINQKSIMSINNALEFSLYNLSRIQFNIILQLTLVKSMLRSGMALNYQEILDLLPKFKSVLVPVVFMECLCQGKFDELDRLKMRCEKIKNVHFVTKWRPLCIDILKNLPMKSIHRIAIEARKLFSNESVNHLLSELIIRKIVESSNNGNIFEIHESIEFGKNFSVTFRRIDVDYLINLLPQQAELFKSSLIVAESVENFVEETEEVLEN